MNKKLNSTINQKENYLVSKICSCWEKFNRDRRTTLDINNLVKEHLTYGDKEKLYGVLPNVKEISESLKAQVENSVLKSPASMFNVVPKKNDRNEEAAIQKANILEKINDGNIINSYKIAIENWIDRGELVLFHEWETIKAKKRVIKENQVQISAVDSEGKEFVENKTIYKFGVEDYVEYEGPTVKAIDPKDFVFDTTKVDFFNTSRCLKIRRSWLPYQEIVNNDLYHDMLSTDKKEILKGMINGKTPSTEQNFDDYNNSVSKNKIDGDLIEVLEFWGDICLEDGEILEDAVITVAGREVVIRQEISPYTKSPWIWIPYFSDLKTRRGFSALVDVIGFNEKATQIWNSILDAMRFSVNPAYWAKKGGHISNKKDKLEPGDILQWNNADGSDVLPQVIDTFKNVPMNFNLITFLEKEMEEVSGVSKYEAGDAHGIARTATETQLLIAGSNSRIARRLLILANDALVPSIEIIARMIADNSEFGANNDINYLSSNGDKKTATVDDYIRQGEYKYTIGSTQSIIEMKAKINEIQSVINAFSKLGANFDISALWNIVSQAYEIPEANVLLQKSNLSSMLQNYSPDEQKLIQDNLPQILDSIVKQKN